MIYRNKNRGEALELIDLASDENLINIERDYDYESKLKQAPFISHIKPKGFSIN